MSNNLPIESKLLNDGGKKSTGNAKNAKGGSTSAQSSKLFTPERVADLPASFDLNSALDKAYDKAVNYMNGMLDSKDLEVDMIETNNVQIGQVTDKITGEKVSSYDGKEILRLYAHNHQIKGVVVDGKI